MKCFQVAVVLLGGLLVAAAPVPVQDAPLDALEKRVIPAQSRSLGPQRFRFPSQVRGN